MKIQINKKGHYSKSQHKMGICKHYIKRYFLGEEEEIKSESLERGKDLHERLISERKSNILSEVFFKKTFTFKVDGREGEFEIIGFLDGISKDFTTIYESKTYKKGDAKLKLGAMNSAFEDLAFYAAVLPGAELELHYADGKKEALGIVDKKQFITVGETYGVDETEKVVPHIKEKHIGSDTISDKKKEIVDKVLEINDLYELYLQGKLMLDIECVDEYVNAVELIKETKANKEEMRDKILKIMEQFVGDKKMAISGDYLVNVAAYEKSVYSDEDAQKIKDFVLEQGIVQLKRKYQQLRVTKL